MQRRALEGQGPSSKWALAPALAFVAVFLAAQLALIPRLNANWDEYFFLSHVYAHDADRLADPMQTFHVHLFSWLPSVGSGEVDQIVAARFVMLLLELASLGCVYAIARNFSTTQDAAYAVAIWCGFGFALAHGMAFRSDPIASAAMMGALALLSRPTLRLWQAMLAGLLGSLAVLVTIKSVLYLPAFVAVGILWLSRSMAWKPLLLRAFSALLTFGLAVLAFYLWHAQAVIGLGETGAAAVGPAPAALDRAGDHAGSSARKMFDLFLPRQEDVLRWAALSLVPLGILGLSIAIAIRGLFAPSNRYFAFAFLLFGAPLASVLVYRNAFPYFFPFITFPVVLAALPGIARLDTKWRNLLLVPMAAMLLMQFALNWQRDQVTQRATGEVAYRMFPESVSYLDRNGMLARYPMVGGFGSTWGLGGSRTSPRYATIIERHQPPLLIANTPVFQKALDPEFAYPDRWLSNADEQALRETYIHHWGLIYVAGKQLDRLFGSFVLPIAGEYTLECTGVRLVDGKTHDCGELVELSRGKHSWSGGRMTLRWGDRLYRPQAVAPTQPIYYGYFSAD